MKNEAKVQMMPALNEDYKVNFTIEDSEASIQEELTFGQALEVLNSDIDYAIDFQEELCEDLDEIEVQDIDEQYIIEEMLVNTRFTIPFMKEKIKSLNTQKAFNAKDATEIVKNEMKKQNVKSVSVTDMMGMLGITVIDHTKKAAGVLSHPKRTSN